MKRKIPEFPIVPWSEVYKTKLPIERLALVNGLRENPSTTTLIQLLEWCFDESRFLEIYDWLITPNSYLYNMQIPLDCIEEGNTAKVLRAVNLMLEFDYFSNLPVRSRT